MTHRDYRYHEEEQALSVSRPLDPSPVVYPDEYLKALKSCHHPKHEAAMKIRAERMKKWREGNGELPRTYDAEMEARREIAMYSDNQRNYL